MQRLAGEQPCCPTAPWAQQSPWAPPACGRGCWCLESWSSEQLEGGTARLPWAFLRQPVPGWLSPSSPTTLTHLHCHGQCLSSSPPAPALLPLGLTRLQPGMAGVPQVHARLSWTLSAFSRRDDSFVRYLIIVVQYPVQGWGDGGFHVFLISYLSITRENKL